MTWAERAILLLAVVALLIDTVNHRALRRRVEALERKTEWPF